jgi:hypothetical protein
MINNLGNAYEVKEIWLSKRHENISNLVCIINLLDPDALINILMEMVIFMAVCLG